MGNEATLRVEEVRGTSEYLSVYDVASYTGLSPQFWNDLRYKGGGPTYSKLSPKVVRYRREDIDAFMAAHARRSTFDGAERLPVPAEGRR
jgi:predicted DNA-binding transcriptional regulator AlpA